jgi:hypothetical protein
LNLAGAEQSVRRSITAWGTRRRWVFTLTGSCRVLEIGVGSGVNLPLYSNDVTGIVGLDSSPRLRLTIPCGSYGMVVRRRGRKCNRQLLMACGNSFRNECNIDDGDVESCVFDGGHDWSDMFYQTAGRLLAELQSGP